MASPAFSGRSSIRNPPGCRSSHFPGGSASAQSSRFPWRFFSAPAASIVRQLERRLLRALMRLPHLDKLIVEREKIVEYLLNPRHPYGAGKARFFRRHGFNLADWELLARTLRDHGRENQVTRTADTGFGPRYEVEGEIKAPDGRRPRVRTIWQFDRGQIAPRLITAYPLKRRL